MCVRSGRQTTFLKMLAHFLWMLTCLLLTDACFGRLILPICLIFLLNDFHSPSFPDFLSFSLTEIDVRIQNTDVKNTVKKKPKTNRFVKLEMKSNFRWTFRNIAWNGSPVCKYSRRLRSYDMLAVVHFRIPGEVKQRLAKFMRSFLSIQETGARHSSEKFRFEHEPFEKWTAHLSISFPLSFSRFLSLCR